MLNTEAIGLYTAGIGGARRQFPLTRSQALRLVNIADIRSGGRVWYEGRPDRTLEAAVYGLGARFIDGKPGPRLPTGSVAADVALGCLSGWRGRDAVQLLQAFRRCLRPGGRMAVWAIPDAHRRASGLTGRLPDLAGGAGFTSVIVGRLPADRGQTMIVATGIINKWRSNTG